jgi:23S rRNA (uridine2552-2'-O)-methyltransferase
MARTRTSKAWMQEHVNDPFVRRAQAEGMRSRAAYKLEQLAGRDKLLKPGMVVVDLGAAPGGWSQVAARAVGGSGLVVGVDLLDMAPLPGVRFLRGDFGDDAVLNTLLELLGGRGVDLVLSDMAPNISGVASVDQARSIGLAELAMDFALKHLKPQGNFLVKVFQGEGFDALVAAMRRRFVQVLIRKPEASRSRSSEVYLVGKGLKAAA